MPHLKIRNILILTRRGAEFLQCHSNAFISNPLIDKTKIAFSGLQHTIAVQHYALNELNQDTMFLTEHELRLLQQPGNKVPDFKFTNKEGHTISAEIELSCKSEQQLCIALSHALLTISQGKTDQVHYLSSSKAILRKYEKILRRQKIPLWSYDNKSRKWRPQEDQHFLCKDFKNFIYFGFKEIQEFKQFIG